MTVDDLILRLGNIERDALDATSGATDTATAREVLNSHLGRKSEFSEIKKSLGALPEEARRQVGRRANEVRELITQAVERKVEDLGSGEQEARLRAEALDVTLPGRVPPRGRLHPITQVMDELVDVFIGLGFRVEEGPEVESDYYNFVALNIPENHPARSMIDTMYLQSNEHGQPLIRTHTSPVQARVMEKTEPPIYVVVPGRCGRRDPPDPKRLPIFHQLEGLAVDDGISFADMKGTLEAFARAMFGPRQRIRLTPTYYPFTEPSADISLLCFVCEGSGCSTCRGEGWIEILGAGMVHPNVFRAAGYKQDTTGFAFGMGIERVAMLRYQVPDIRWFLENDLQFLEAF